MSSDLLMSQIVVAPIVISNFFAIFYKSSGIWYQMWTTIYCNSLHVQCMHLNLYVHHLLNDTVIHHH